MYGQMTYFYKAGDESWGYLKAGNLVYSENKELLRFTFTEYFSVSERRSLSFFIIVGWEILRSHFTDGCAKIAATLWSWFRIPLERRSVSAFLCAVLPYSCEVLATGRPVRGLVPCQVCKTWLEGRVPFTAHAWCKWNWSFMRHDLIL